MPQIFKKIPKNHLVKSVIINFFNLPYILPLTKTNFLTAVRRIENNG